MKLRKYLFWPVAAAAACAFIGTPARGGYLQQAEEATDYIQTNFYVPSEKRYHTDFPVDPKGLPWDMMWGNGVIYSDLALGARQDPGKYRTALYQFSDGLQSYYWDPEAPVPGFNAYCSGPRGTDKYYDDNAWMVRGYLEAYRTTRDKQFLDLARATQTFVLSGWDDVLGGGIYWRLNHQGKTTCSNAPTAAAALELANAGGDKDQIDWASKIRTWVNKTLQDPDGLYYDSVNLNGDVEKHEWTYNTALMIITDAQFYQLNHQAADLSETRRIADAAMAAWYDPATHSLQKTEDSPLFIQYLCEALLRAYDVTHDKKYLNAVRDEADYGYKVGRDPEGGYWEHWNTKPHDGGERKTLIINASAARIFWLLAPYEGKR